MNKPLVYMLKLLVCVYLLIMINGNIGDVFENKIKCTLTDSEDTKVNNYHRHELWILIFNKKFPFTNNNF